MIEVFYDKPCSYATLIAVFEDEDAYMACVPALEAHAESRGYVLTERMVEEYDQ